MNSRYQLTAACLLLLSASVGGCTSNHPSPEANLQQEQDELDELIDTTRGQAADAQGQPVTVPTTIPERPAGASDTHGHDSHDMPADAPAEPSEPSEPTNAL